MLQVDAIQPDKQLLSSLRDLRTALSGPNLDLACALVRQAAAERGNERLVRKIDRVLRAVLKAILLIGNNLATTNEYKDVFDDILTKVKLRKGAAMMV